MSTLLHRWLLLGRILVDPRLSRVDAAVAWWLLQMFNPARGRAWPSLVTLASRVGASRRAVISSIERLVAAGYFGRTRGGGRGHANEYLPRFETVASTSPFRGGEDKGKGEGQSTVSPGQTVKPNDINSEESVLRNGEAGFTPTCLRNPSSNPSKPRARARAAARHKFSGEGKAVSASSTLAKKLTSRDEADASPAAYRAHRRVVQQLGEELHALPLEKLSLADWRLIEQAELDEPGKGRTLALKLLRGAGG